MVGIPQWMRARLHGRPDSEHEPAILRVALGIGLGLYLLVPHLMDGTAGSALVTLVPFGIFVLAAFAIFGAILLRPGESPARRVLGALVDSATISYFMIQLSADGLVLYVIYLWIIIGNGFRYGRFYLLNTLVLSAMGFSIVIMLSDFWLEHIAAGVGLLVGMILISLYVLTLVQRLSTARDQIETALFSHRRLTSKIAQEMRTPLNAVMGVAELLRQGQPGDPDTARTLDDSSREMLGLVDALDDARAEATYRMPSAPPSIRST